MDLTGFQNAIQAQVKAATGFDDSHVIWSKQTRDRPARPFVELDDLDNATNFFTEDTVSDTPGAPVGEEITLTSKEDVEITVQVRVFTTVVTGSSNAFNTAQKIRGWFSRDSVTSLLGDIALVDRDAVRDASIVLETEYEGRAILTLKFRVASLETETTTYIETPVVETTVTQTSGDVIHTITITQ